MNVNIVGPPDTAKTTTCAVPDKRLGKRLILAASQTAHSLRGIPAEWRESIDVELLGFKDDRRQKLQSYYRAIMRQLEEPRGEYDTIILDDITTMIRAYYNDVLTSMGGIASEYRRENESPQNLALAATEALWACNPNKNIIILQHAKEVRKDSAEGRVLDTYLPELVGSKLDDVWPGRFDASLFFERQVLRKPKGEPEVRFLAHFVPERTHRFVFVRTELGHEKPPVSLDLTIENPLNHEPVTMFWDALFGALRCA